MNYHARVIPTKLIVSFPGAKDHARVIPAKAGTQSFQEHEQFSQFILKHLHEDPPAVAPA
jgi:hypothetical protein